MSRSRQGSEAGFTLIELLVSITLLSLIMLALFGGLRFGARVWERSETHMAGVNDIGRVQALLRRELREAYPFYVTAGSAYGHVDFSGTPSAITFLGPAPQSLAAAGRARITLRALRADAGWTLEMDVQPELGWQGGRTEALLTGLKSVKFSYFGTTDRGRPAAWHDSWANAQRLPMLVRIDVGFDKKGAPVWPELVIAPVITVDVNCTYEPLTRDCQGR